MISVDGVTIRFGAFVLFDRISFQVNPGDRIGLVGRNGAGKTTILNLIARKQDPDEGRVVISSDSSVGYLPQQMRHKKGKTLYKETLEAFSEVLHMKKQIETITRELEEREDHHSDSYLSLIQELSNANEQFEMEGGHSIHADVEQTLIGLGFEIKDMERPVHEFSGGWRMRVELAKILLRRPDYILLDEPTNHLDIESIQWLESFLGSYQGGVLIISHDRIFLDRVTNRTLELSLGKTYDYRVSYSRYVELKQERITVQNAAYDNQQKLIQETEQFINRFRYKATKAVQVQSRIKQLNKLDRIEVEKEDDMVMNLRFPPAKRSGTIVVEADGLGKSFGDHRVLDGVDLVIERGEKVAFVGRNGEGKTTLSRILIGELDHTGGLKLGHNVELGYFAQNQDEIMDGNLTVLETVDRVAVGDIRGRIRDILGAFIFSGEDVEKRVKVLSGGERSRLAMARMLLQPFNLLILDEPTNHLDMRSKDILKNALLAFDGTLIVVSHDREFLDGLVDKVFEFRKQKVKEHIGGIFEFLQRRKIATLKDIEKKDRAHSTAPVATGVEKKKKKTATKDQLKEGGKPPEEDAPKTESDNKLQYEERKALEKKIRKISNRVKALEREVEEIEAELAKMDTLLMNPDNIQGMQVYEEYEQLKKRHDEALASWEKQTIQLEKTEARRK
ncbi:MAG: ABC-F family ATP-binding cassette domain-containing protein [Bacteroidetes bacterium]|nr:ABC-F family ATP-binding cassette domain-containing protein [Bacteroidota bacterium]